MVQIIQIILLSIAVTSAAIALMSSIYELGVLNGKIQAYKWIEQELEKSRARLKEKLKGDTRRSDEPLANDNGGGSGTGESTDARKSI